MSQYANLGLLTLGVPPEAYRLPHPRLGLPIILVVRRVLVRAFEVLFERGLSLATETEDRITAALHAVIENDFRPTGSVAGFDGRTFCSVVRQSQATNFDLSRLGKTPDLCFRLRTDEEEPRLVLASHNALFVECKPVDGDHPAGSFYCDDGLNRFVGGDYAWAMEEGMMVGYSRASRTISQHLMRAMQKPERIAALKTVELPLPVEAPGAAASNRAEALHASRHHRGFPWPDGKGLATDIVIYHSWHRCD